MKRINDVCYSKESNQYLDIYLPECESFPVVVYFHGGGIEAGDKSCEQNLLQYMCNHGIAVISANYRMYPNAKYPEFIVDAAQAVAWAFENMGTYGKVEGIYVGGSSAGGYLSQMLCFDSSYLAKHGIKPTDVAGFILDAGQPTSHFNVLREKGVDSRRVIIDETAPLYFVGMEKEYSPMLVIVSDRDMMNRYEQTMLLLSTLKHFGHGDKATLKLMHGTHCAYVNALDENGESILGKLIYEFIYG